MMPQLGETGRQMMVEQLVATVHICLQHTAKRSPVLDKAQTRILNAVLFALGSTKVQLSL